MLSDHRRRFLQRMDSIFNENNLNNSEIVSVLSAKYAMMENERVEAARCQLADLLITEKLSIQEGRDLIAEYYQKIILI